MIALLSTTWACGGLFCNTSQPVEQTAESLVFGVDAEAGTTTMHVQINYEGDAADFAWVLPLPSQPEVFRSTEVLFSVLSSRTRPALRIQSENCGSLNNRWPAGDGDTDADADADTDTDADADAPVQVVGQEQVGPYETVTLTATDADALVTWLQVNEYAVPSSFGEAVAPYIGTETNFLALKLRSGETSGSIEPLGVRWAGTTPSIPIRLTALAVADELPIRVYMIADDRAVPENYFHTVLNPLEFDWRNGTLGDSVVRATAESSGHAFYTAFSDEVDVTSQVRVPSFLEASLGLAGSWADVVQTLAGNISIDDLQRVVPVPEEATSPTAYFSAVANGSIVPEEPFDIEVVQQRFQMEVVAVRTQAAELLDLSSRVTRLDSTMVASQMTVDPMFGVRPGLPNVSNVHVLQVDRECDDRDNQTSRITVDGEFSFVVPSENDLRERDMTILDYLEELQTPASMRVQQTLDDGYETLVDNREQIADIIEQQQRDFSLTADVLVLSGDDPGTTNEEPPLGCGCTTRNVSPVIGLFAILGVAWSRRRDA